MKFAELCKLARKSGAKVHGGCGTRPNPRTGEYGYDIEVEAPNGKLFKATMTHSVVIASSNGLMTNEAMQAECSKALDSLAEDVNTGFMDCDDGKSAGTQFDGKCEVCCSEEVV